jgi:hypothetical protein
MPPPGPGNSGDFRSSHSQVKSLSCGNKRLVNSPPNAPPAPRYIPISKLSLAPKQNHRIHSALRGHREGKNKAHFPRYNRYSPGPGGGGAVVSIDWCIKNWVWVSFPCLLHLWQTWFFPAQGQGFKLLLWRHCRKLLCHLARHLSLSMSNG